MHISIHCKKGLVMKSLKVHIYPYHLTLNQSKTFPILGRLGLLLADDNNLFS